MKASERMEKKLASLPGQIRHQCRIFLRKLSENRKEKIGQVALREGLINHRQLGDALAKQRQLEREGRKAPLGKILVKSKALTRKNLDSLVSS